MEVEGNGRGRRRGRWGGWRRERSGRARPSTSHVYPTVWVRLELVCCAPVVGLAQHVHRVYEQRSLARLEVRDRTKPHPTGVRVVHQPVQLGVEGRRPLGSLVEERACLGVPIHPSVIGMGMV